MAKEDNNFLLVGAYASVYAAQADYDGIIGARPSTR